MKITQKGFGLAEVLILVVVVGALGGVGTLVYTRQRTANKQVPITNFDECVAAGNPVAESYPEQCFANGQSFINQSQKVNEASDDTETPAKTYLTIKEWKIKLELSESIKDGYYYFDSTRSEAEKYKYAYLSLTSLKDTDCSAESVTTGAITRFTEAEKDPISGQTYLSGYPDAPKVGGYYYFFTRPQAMCSEDTDIQTKADKAIQAFRSALTSIQAE
jgi:hypothetical protein